ncbi:MAG: trypsin-like peptidase domain-containing protein [Acidimicrobiia bacterium]|nr:trypsin-like peptidase domain-containing protein [Acidimicrobiia bacterium]
MVVPVLLACSLIACAVIRPDIGGPDYGETSVAADSPERRAEQATVRIRNLGCGAISLGSGVVIGARRLLTNAHVIAGAERLEVNLWDGTTVDARVVGASVEGDLAIVEVEEDLVTQNDAAVADLAPADPTEGQPLMVFGFPEGGRFRISRGRLMGYEDIDGQRSLVLSNRVEEGNSGGPVFDMEGRVVGIVRAKFVDSGEAIAIPVSTLRSLVSGSAASGPVPECGAF